MSETPTTSYDEVPYSSNVFHYTHPNCLATWGLLLGMKPAPVDQCRVLELGCGTGANLIPMAQDLPGSRFLGIDLSPRQIAMGQEIADGLFLRNIELRALSIMDVDESYGQFDYIICHGVYSWVPGEVQEQVLAICSRNLAPDGGIAYVSYNTYPGWHMRGMIREMMGFHARQFTEPKVRIEQARAFLDFLIRAVGGRGTVYSNLLQIEADLLKDASDTYIFHEHLEEVNRPVYFHEFAKRAAAHHLQYLAEARSTLLTQSLSPEVTQTLERLAVDVIHGEQYLDFVRGRTFRRTLLCHQQVALKRPPSPENVRLMQATGVAKPVTEQPNLAADVAEVFTTPEDVKLSSKNPLLKAALVTLFEAWPRSVPFAVLWDRVRARLAATPGMEPMPSDQGREQLAEMLLQCYLSSLVELHARAPEFAVNAGERPTASPLARLQAANGRMDVANRRHRAAKLSDFDRLVLQHLDGTRDRPALVKVLAELAAEGALTVQQGDREVVPDRHLLEEALEPCLYRLAQSAVLIA